MFFSRSRRETARYRGDFVSPVANRNVVVSPWIVNVSCVLDYLEKIMSDLLFFCWFGLIRSAAKVGILQFVDFAGPLASRTEHNHDQ